MHRWLRTVPVRVTAIALAAIEGPSVRMMEVTPVAAAVSVMGAAAAVAAAAGATADAKIRRGR